MLGNGIVTGGWVELRNVRAELDGLLVRDSPISCLLASESASVAVRDCAFEKCKVAGIEVNASARVNATSVIVRHTDGPAFGVPERASLVVDAFEVSDAQTLVWADCEAGATVRMSRGRVNGVEASPAPCVKGDVP